MSAELLAQNALMRDLTAADGAGKSVVMREAGIWLTNFISDRTRETYKKAIGEFTTFAGLESPDGIYQRERRAGNATDG